MPDYKISAKISGDSTEFQKSIKEAQKSSESLENTAEELSDTLEKCNETASDAFAETVAGIESAAASVSELCTEADSASEAVAAIADELKKADDGTASYDNIGKSATAAEKDVDSLNDTVRDTAKEAENACDSVKKFAGTAAGFVILKKSVSSVLNCFKEYADYESSVIRMSELFKSSGDMITEFAERNAKALGMSESAVYKYAATYGNLFSSITVDSEENAKVTMSMLNASAVIASKTGRTIEDVMERIRSGLLGNTEAIEDLGIYVNTAMLETTNAFEKMSDGRSWEQLEYHEQQQIRTLAILEQANKKFGSEISQNSAMSISALTGAFNDLKIATGGLASSALVPLIEVLTGVTQGAVSVVHWFGNLSGTSKTYLGIAAALALGIPAVTLATKGLALAQAGLHAIQAVLIPQTITFGTVLKSALGWISIAALALGLLYAIFEKNNIKDTAEDVSDYSGALQKTQKSASDANRSINNVKDSTHNLANEIKRVLAGFDELNILASDGSTANQSIFGIDTSGLDKASEMLDAFEDVDYSVNFDTNAKSVTEKIRDFFSSLWTNIKSGYKGWARWWSGLGEDMYDGIHDGDWEPLLTRLNGVVESVFGEKWTSFWKEAGENMYTGIKDGDWEPLLTQLNTTVRSVFGEDWTNFWEERGEKMYDAFEKAKEDINPVFAAIYAGAEFVFGENWTNFWEDVGGLIYDSINGNSEAVYEDLEQLDSDIRALFGEDWVDFWEGVGEAVYDAFHYDKEEIEGKMVDKLSNSNVTGAVVAYEIINTKQNSILSDVSDKTEPVPYGPPNLKKFAKGGVVTKATPLIAGDYGAEAIVPLENNIEWINELAEKINTVDCAGNGDIHIHVECESREIGKLAMKYAEIEKARKGGW